MRPERLRTTIISAKSGSAQAYRELLESYGPRLYGYFVQALRNHHEAEDMLGEMSLKLVKKLGTYDDRGKFDPWLFRIAANMVRDRYRRSKTRPKTHSFSGDDESSPMDRLAGSTEAVDSRLIMQETLSALNDAMVQLDEPTRRVIEMRHFGQMSFKEIAAEVGSPIGTVLARVHRGLKTLRRLMGRETFEL